jgi:photosynthetic reaction center cytochrome c subunit
MRRQLCYLAVLVAVPWLASCHRTQEVQRGYRGQASVELFSESTLRKQDEINKYPKPLRAANTNPPTAAEFYQNVHVLGDLSKQQFARTMLSIKAWVAPEQGCNYCHNAPDYTNDDKYTKRVAREMLRMTRHINTDWTAHVGKVGVTCYTCHRGQPVPAKYWYSAPDRNVTGDSVTRPSQRLPTAAAGNTVLPIYALDDYLLHDDNIRVVGPTALQTGNRRSVLQARDTYGLMMVMAESLGVNCTFCHYTPAFYNWDQSTPQRATAWYGIRMVRDLNNTVMVPLTNLLPKERLGPTGDVPKIYCATCHQGSNKPLYGVPMLPDYPELVRPKPESAPGAPADSGAPAAPGMPPATTPATGGANTASLVAPANPVATAAAH